MQFISTILLVIHVLAGVASLILFWIPALTRKGGRNHRLAGRWYVKAMWVVVVTAISLSVKNVIIGDYVLAAFLGFLSLLTAKPLWMGTAILSSKHGVNARYRSNLMVLNALLVIAGATLIYYGIVLGAQGIAVFLLVFGGLGLSNIIEFVGLWRAPDSRQIDWRKQHIVGMGTSGIAAHTAFLAFGASSLITSLVNSYWALAPWLAPTVIGTIAIRLAVGKYCLDKSRNSDVMLSH
ncbi:hypothetical protein [Arenicella xantha]|uniref:Uncharacterized protein n=1 Tax=Arenicella xantha TaxID=644221 RepID=A0A395JMG5_9GAMM|nr:hypothetical protein [Arenicella xantha]RBP52820.1 hypothetical protein DFR28_101204 [Arenicella xantha]